MKPEVALAPLRDCAISSIVVSGNRKKSPENAKSSIWLASNLTNARMKTPLDLYLPSNIYQICRPQMDVGGYYAWNKVQGIMPDARYSSCYRCN
jgi:hypothetical protein